MSCYGKYIEAYDILNSDGIKLQEAVEQEDAIYDRFDEFILRRIYTYIKMFRIMTKMIEEDLTLIKKFNPLFDALFEKYAIIALDREWTKKDFLGVKNALKNIHRMNERWIEYYDIINDIQHDDNSDLTDSNSDVYEEVKEEINRKIFLREYNELDKTNHPVNLKPFISKNIQKESNRRNDILNEVNEDNEITTKTIMKKVIDMRDESGRDILEMFIKTKTKSITIKFIDEQN
jgi:hypothetical protein